MAEDNNEKYDLYTEHIVPESGKKVKKFFKRLGLVAVMALFFGMVAGLVMVLVYRVGVRVTEPEPTRQDVTLHGNNRTEPAATTEPVMESTVETTSHEMVTIAPVEPTIEETTEAVTDEANTETSDDGEFQSGIDNLNVISSTLKKVYKTVSNSSVVITASAPGKDWFEQSYQNVRTDYGIVIAEDVDSYYIMTDYHIIDGAEKIMITYPDASVATGEYVMGDSTTGIAVIKTPIVKKDGFGVAVLGDSGTVLQGDVVVAIGKLYGYDNSLGYGFATSVDNVIYDTDSSYTVIATSISSTANSTGVLANLNGEIVGVITGKYSQGCGLVGAYAISDIRELLENLINAKKTIYFGIKGQDSNTNLTELYGVPEGIYVSAVELASPAYAAGIQIGDVITAIDGKEIATVRELGSAISKHDTGDAVEVKVKRKGRDSYKEIVFSVTLGVE